MPGDVHRGPDNLWYRLGYDEQWRLHPRSPVHDQDPELEPEPEQPKDDDGNSWPPAERAEFRAFNQRIRAEEAEEDRRHALARRAALEAAERRGDHENMIADIYEGEYEDVIAEAGTAVRRDGWTAERRVLFLERLAEKGSVIAAARAAGVARQSVYKLLKRAPAFRAVFDETLAHVAVLLADTAFDRALHGTEEPVFHKGELVGHRTVHHDRLLAYLLRVRDPLNFAPVDELDRWQKHRPLTATATPLPARLPTPTTPPADGSWPVPTLSPSSPSPT